MADTTALKNRIRAAIKTNDNQEITGPVLQQALLDIVDELDLNPELENEAQRAQQAEGNLGQRIIDINSDISDINSDISNIKNISNTGLPYVKQLTLNGLTSNDNLFLRIQANDNVNFQIYQGGTLLCWANLRKTEYEDYYLITHSNLNNLPLREYQSSGVTGTISLYTNKILKSDVSKSDVSKSFPFTYPGKDYRLLNIIEKCCKDIIDINSDIIDINSDISDINSDISDIKNISNTGLPYVKQLTLNGLTSNDNLNLRIAVGSAINFQIYQGRTLLCWANLGKTEYEDYYLITRSNLNNLPLGEYQSSGVTGTISLYTNKILKSDVSKSDVSKSFPFTYPFDDYPLLDAIRNALNSHKEIVIEKLNTPDISWVDDDFPLDSVLRIKNLGLQLGFRSDFGLIPRTTGGTGKYPTDFTFSFTSEQLAVIKEVENAGFHCEHHPVHRGWYSSESAGTYQGRQYIEYLLCSGMRLFNENNILNDSCVIYPGGSGSNNEAIETCRSHVQFGIAASGPDANVGSVNPMTLGRLFINAISSSQTKTYWKNRILNAYNTNGWIILGTHSAMFDNSGTIDETTASFANLAEIIEYANTLSTIKPVSEVYRKRKPMLDLYNI